MAYGHAERNLAALELLQRQIDQLMEQRARERSGPQPQPDDSPADGAGRRQDSRARVPVPPDHAGDGT
jgi:hypothetical protein